MLPMPEAEGETARSLLLGDFSVDIFPIGVKLLSQIR
jgi:hypothetical protein